MKLTTTSRGFEIVEGAVYPAESGPDARIVQQSSAMGDDPFGAGSGFLWVGANHHLDREEVMELAKRLTAWLYTGSLRVEGDE
jgi:hypothetical protein